MVPILTTTPEPPASIRYSPLEKSRTRLTYTVAICLFASVISTLLSLGVACCALARNHWVLVPLAITHLLLFLTVSLILITNVKHKLRGGKLISEISNSIRKIETDDYSNKILFFQHATQTCIPHMRELFTKSLVEKEKEIKEKQHRLDTFKLLQQRT